MNELQKLLLKFSWLKNKKKWKHNKRLQKRFINKCHGMSCEYVNDDVIVKHIHEIYALYVELNNINPMVCVVDIIKKLQNGEYKITEPIELIKICNNTKPMLRIQNGRLLWSREAIDSIIEQGKGLCEAFCDDSLKEKNNSEQD